MPLCVDDTERKRMKLHADRDCNGDQTGRGSWQACRAIAAPDRPQTCRAIATPSRLRAGDDPCAGGARGNHDARRGRPGPDRARLGRQRPVVPSDTRSITPCLDDKRQQWLPADVSGHAIRTYRRARHGEMVGHAGGPRNRAAQLTGCPLGAKRGSCSEIECRAIARLRRHTFPNYEPKRRGHFRS